MMCECRKKLIFPIFHKHMIHKVCSTSHHWQVPVRVVPKSRTGRLSTRDRRLATASPLQGSMRATKGFKGDAHAEFQFEFQNFSGIPIFGGVAIVSRLSHVVGRELWDPGHRRRNLHISCTVITCWICAIKTRCSFFGRRCHDFFVSFRLLL